MPDALNTEGRFQSGQMMLKNLSHVIRSSEDWLIHRILHYACIHGYSQYTSTLAEAWRLSISGLSASLIAGIDHYGSIPEMSPEDDFQDDPLTRFGNTEARRHRERGVSLSMFLGLMKYYRQCYVDLIREKTDTIPDSQQAHLFIDRCFDRIEIAFIQVWTETDQDDRIQELQAANRLMTNEKNAYLTVFESLSDPAIILNAQNEIITANHAAMSLVDTHSIPGAVYYKPGDNRYFQHQTAGNSSPMTCETVVGCPVEGVFPWLKKITKNLAEIVKTGRRQECRAIINESERCFEAKAAPMLDISEKFTTTILSLREVTKRETMKKALQESEARFRTLFEASIEGIVLHDLVCNENNEPVDYRIIDVNPAFSRHTGIPRETALGKTGRQLYQTDSSPYFETFLEVALTGRSTLFETYFETMDRYFRISVFSPKQNSFATVFEDITEKKLAEQRLRESERRYKSLFYNNHAVMLLIDPADGRIKDANPAAESYYQYDREALLAMKISEINTMDPKAVAGAIQQILEGKVHQLYFQHRLATGEIRDVEVFSGPIVVFGKQLLYSIIHDVTDRKKMEEALRKSNRELDDFAYIASHDLKEPLRGISNYAMFLMEDYGDKIDAEGKAKLETLQRLCRREEALIQSLLNYSRVGRSDLQIETMDLNPLMGEVREMVAASFTGQSVHVHLPRPLPTIQGDVIQIREVFFNLVSNAVKYNEQPHKQIEIGCFENNGGDLPPAANPAVAAGFPVLYVRDNGIGIPAKHREKVFTIFKRLHGRDKFGGGTGAGLTIVKKIVERHGGRIWLDSAVGVGTTFYFTLQPPPH